ncbi:ABC transporter ATP-binding protein [Planctomycetes bacterium Pan216]|uniref:ABC transporter ATP-binding protein n=1 Tax=Kolteria novifilia TaxID=2527975 RepID=A0A518B7Y5_9BACT|nr:ABC transporter ATP-binding protein [Planctomycetes bacterium Pan216]
MAREVAKLEDVHKVYDLGDVKVSALRGIDLTFCAGDYVAIMGASGSGKSTMLNLLGCLDRPTSGRYLLDGQDVAQLDDNELSEIRSRAIGFIFQSYNLIPQLTVVENIEVPLYYQGRVGAETREHVVELIEMVGLGHRLDHRPFQLSGGQQQRVGIARALACDPAFILADEPTGNLDSATSEEIMELLARLNQMGKTIVLVTHEDEVAFRAKRIVRMRDGQVMDDVMVPEPETKSAFDG